jgi:hypothetical protein
MSSELWLDDIHVGDRFRTDTYDLTADDIIDFATKWDPQPFHLSDETARETFFKGLAASGWHTAAITMPGPPQRDRAINSTSRSESPVCGDPHPVRTAASSRSPSTP